MAIPFPTATTVTAEGYSNHEMAGRLGISTKTVDTYRRRIMEKLGLHHRAELVHDALDHGLLRPHQPDIEQAPCGGFPMPTGR